MTFGTRALSFNPASVGFVYLVLVLVIATTWGFAEAIATSIVATMTFNYFFLEPVGTFTIQDPQNWVALFSFLATSLIASRLSEKAKRRAQDAIERGQDLERLYSFSRAILLIDDREPFAKQLIQKLADIFPVTAAVLFERATGETYRAGPAEFAGLEEQLQQTAMHGTSYADPAGTRVITAVRLGSEPIAALALEGFLMPDSVLQGIANLVAIGLERARAEDLARQVETARRGAQLRTTLLDALAHEFKTPLTSIRAATTSLLASPGQPEASRTELLTIADEEAERLRELIDDSIEMARLDDLNVQLRLEQVSVCELVRELVQALHTDAGDGRIAVDCEGAIPTAAVDRRLLRLALKQLLDNALKYSPPASPVAVRIGSGDGAVSIEVTNGGNGIPPQEQNRIFDRFYRSPSVKQKIPGSGLGLCIAQSIAQAHGGTLTVRSRPGETTFRLAVPLPPGESM